MEHNQVTKEVVSGRGCAFSRGWDALGLAGPALDVSDSGSSTAALLREADQGSGGIALPLTKRKQWINFHISPNIPSTSLPFNRLLFGAPKRQRPPLAPFRVLLMGLWDGLGEYDSQERRNAICRRQAQMLDEQIAEKHRREALKEKARQRELEEERQQFRPKNEPQSQAPQQPWQPYQPYEPPPPAAAQQQFSVSPPAAARPLAFNMAQAARLVAWVALEEGAMEVLREAQVAPQQMQPSFLQQLHQQLLYQPLMQLPSLLAQPPQQQLPQLPPLPKHSFWEVPSFQLPQLPPAALPSLPPQRAESVDSFRREVEVASSVHGSKRPSASESPRRARRRGAVVDIEAEWREWDARQAMRPQISGTATESSRESPVPMEKVKSDHSSASSVWSKTTAMAMASALLATVDPLPALPPPVAMRRCAFSCLGCPSHDARRSHEELSLVEHVRLLLQAVIEMKRSLEQVHGKANIRDDGPCDLPMEPLPAPVENAAEKPPSRASSEALGQRWPPSSETVEVPEPPTAPAPLPAPEAPPAAPESPETPAPAPWREEVPGTVPPPTAPPAVAPMAAPVAAPVAAPAEVSDTGQMDLLQLLNTQAHQEQPAPEVKVETTAAEAEPEGPAAKDATGRSVLTRTLQLPGLAEAPAPEDSAGAGTAAPAVSAGVQRTSIAAALWQTTPEEPAVPEVSVAAAASAAAASAANAAAAAAAADVSDETKDSDEAAFAMLNRATAQLQQNRLSHSEAAETFSELVAQLPPGRLRCSALLNRAHCYVGMGKLEAALSDIETITQGGPTEDGFDPKQWHKVWMSRGGIRRKLAQLQGSEELYAQSKADYEYVLSIRPLNESYVTKARRCLQQLASRESERGRSVRDSEGKLQASPSPKRRRLDASRSRSRSPAIPAPSTALAATAAETAPDTARGPKLPLGSKALQALPEDAAAAGRRLFWEGAVSRPSLSGPSSSQRRYEVSVQGVTEVVQLHATAARSFS
eukprot:s3961_g2.t1